MLWFNFILGLNFIFLCFGVYRSKEMSLEQREIDSVADSMKVTLGIRNCTLRNYCSVVTRANHYNELRITIAQISNDQLPKQPFTGSNPTLLGALFYRNCNKPWPPRPIV